MTAIILVVLIAGLGYIVLSMRDFIRQILRILELQGLLLRECLELLRATIPVHGFTIHQGDSMTITGIKAGGTGTFTATPQPPGSQLPAGNIPAWTASDPSITLAPTADGLGVAAGVPVGSPLTEFNLTITAQPLGDGSVPAQTVTVPVLAPEVTGFDVNQVS